MPAWLLWSGLCALLYAAEGAWVKRIGGRGASPAFMGLCAAAFMTPPLWVAASLDGLPTLQPGFWPALLATVAGNTLALLLYYRAFSVGELSVIFPLLTLTPAWMLLTTHAITGEFPSARGLSGVVLATFGCYALQLEGDGLLAPLKRLWKRPGSRDALLAGLVWSLCANFDKVAVNASSRFFHPAMHGVLLTLVLLPWALKRSRPEFRRLATVDGWRDYGVLGLVSTGIVLTQFMAVALVQPTYVIAVKRAGIVPGVVIGWLIHREAHGPRRLALSLVVLAGLWLMV